MVIQLILLKKTIRGLKSNRGKPPTQNNKQKQKIFIPCPYYSLCSITLANKIQKLLKLPGKQIIFGFKARHRISSLFSKTYRCGADMKKVIYGYSCYNCNGYYINLGETSRGAEVRKDEYMNAFNGNLFYFQK